MGIPIKWRINKFYRHAEDGDEVYAICECEDNHVYYYPIDWRGERERMLSHQFYYEYKRIGEEEQS
ncbi:hypothetical protein [Paenibacillus amylolyticus]|uniref:hypothetical protein n=1 Tax=Paenibacillus amylolyticus TaxID=1451 RepID=UPI00096E4473|nr:hypothetical protein [Paenibacillus amylolyticus]OMF47741.1 hypothetical protein BK136_02280 [Paenibacillus amylolyticus]